MKKTMIFITGSALYCSAIIADSNEMKENPFMQGELMSMPPKEEYQPAYNAPARVLLQEDKGWPDFSINASFLYYSAIEDGLDLANSASLIGGLGSTMPVATSNSIGIVQKSTYKPGFKVGVGMAFDDWSSNVEYTWIRQTTSTNQSAPAPDAPAGTGVWIFNNWFQQPTPAGQMLSATNLSSKWHLGMDLLDFTLGRPFYQARNITISPFFGIRTAWIRQDVNITADVPAVAVNNLIATPVYSHNHSGSWALGARTGFGSSWLLGRGFRLEGDAAASLLFTQYTTISHSEQSASSSANPTMLRTKLSDMNYVRPQAEIGLGLGWGSYLSQQAYYIDFSANYEFLVFWQQNMIRKSLDQVISGIGAAPGNLYLQGLNVKASFYF